MGQSPTAYLAYGIELGEGQILPWEDEETEYDDIDHWWEEAMKQPGPCPAEVVSLGFTLGSGSVLLAVPGSVRSVSYGSLAIDRLPDVSAEKISAFADFCGDHGIAEPYEPQWRLGAAFG